MKKDLYNNKVRWENWKYMHFINTPKGIRKADWALLVEFLKDMELGLNTPKGFKGKRSEGTLLNLSSHNKLFLTHFKKSISKLTKKDLHKLENDISTGKIKKKSGSDYTSFGNYVKDFKVFWGWLMRTGKVQDNITEDITSKVNKPNWVYLSEEDIKAYFNTLLLDYRTYCFFLYDTGARVTEALSIKVGDFSDDFKKVTISDEIAKTFGRTINLKICSGLVKDFVKQNNLKSDDYLINKKPFTINKYLKYHVKKMFGGDNISHPKTKGLYKDFTMYDIRHNSACYWYNRYPTEKGIKYRFGWRKTDKIEYYSGFLGVADEITDEDILLTEDKNKVHKLESGIDALKAEMQEMKNMLFPTHRNGKKIIKREDLFGEYDVSEMTLNELIERQRKNEELGISISRKHLSGELKAIPHGFLSI